MGGPSARIKSIEILEVISSALKTFRSESSSALDDLDIELHRALNWIHQDRTEYWKQELRRSDEKVSEAKIQLKQAQSSRKLQDYRPSCVDEQRALERAKQRNKTAEMKCKAVQHWTQTIDRAVTAVQRARGQFSLWLDSDVEKAIAALNRMSETLETYVTLEAPARPTDSIVLQASKSLQEFSGDELPSAAAPLTPAAATANPATETTTATTAVGNATVPETSAAASVTTSPAATDAPAADTTSTDTAVRGEAAGTTVADIAAVGAEKAVAEAVGVVATAIAAPGEPKETSP
jgi:hypothetical protein